jgi:hypothetical protein
MSSHTGYQSYLAQAWASGEYEHYDRGGPKRRSTHGAMSFRGFSARSYDVAVARKYHLRPFREPRLLDPDKDLSYDVPVNADGSPEVPTYITDDGTRVCIISNPAEAVSATTRKHIRIFEEAIREQQDPKYSVIVVDIPVACGSDTTGGTGIPVGWSAVATAGIETLGDLCKCCDHMYARLLNKCAALQAARPAKKSIRDSDRRAKLFAELKAYLDNYAALAEFLSRPAPSLADLGIAETAEIRNLKACAARKTAKLKAKKGTTDATDTVSPA